MQPLSEPSNEAVLQKLTEGFELLAQLHRAVAEMAPDPDAARRHVDNATRELAALQRMLDRRRRME